MKTIFAIAVLGLFNQLAMAQEVTIDNQKNASDIEQQVLKLRKNPVAAAYIPSKIITTTTTTQDNSTSDVTVTTNTTTVPSKNYKVGRTPVISVTPTTPAATTVTTVTPLTHTEKPVNAIVVADKPASSTVNANCAPPVVHKPIYHKKHMIQKHVVSHAKPHEINLQDTTLLNTAPNISFVPTPVHYLSSKDITVDITHPSSKTFEVSVKDLNGQAVAHDNFVQLSDGGDFSAHSLDSRLTHIKSFSTSSDNNTTVFKFTDEKAGDCTGFYFTYSLKADQALSTKHIFIGSHGEITDRADSSCKIPEGNPHDTMKFSKADYVTTLSWRDAFNSSKKPLTFDVFVTLEGKELFPQNLTSYAVSTDFRYFGYALGTPNKKGAYYGSFFTMSLPSDSYFMNIGFDYDNGNQSELVTIPTIVQ